VDLNGPVFACLNLIVPEASWDDKRQAVSVIFQVLGSDAACRSCIIKLLSLIDTFRFWNKS